MLDQVRTTTCPRNQHVAGGRAAVLIYVRMNINYDQTVSKGLGVAESKLYSGPSPTCKMDNSYIMEQFPLHTWE